ncbi:sensor histidine kinase [Mastigocoleus testarum]|uniref:Histidine kinase n=1 Tax=Mastigocoleus testarum BC008 TaxID=371196 RepID=A0A0V7ZZ89_9CYAN|nr:CHASE2 domain-containing protein [Mastigocoleus testarum]KST69893.1 histidine kinase [Mastigocoleus testarum BC008]KST70056.1 histidine kinase [Mastigocoleus testarum BC008]
MLQKVIKIIKDEIPIWRAASIPGIVIILIVIIARFSGSLQFPEWMLFDTFLKMRPHEPIDEKIVIVGINEKDIEKIGRYPIPDSEIAELIKKISNYKPRIIGLDIFKNVPVEPGSNQLSQVFKETKNLIGIEKVLNPEKISPPPDLPQKQVGFVDIIPDRDGKYRRHLLWTPNPDKPNDKKEDKFSFSLRLVKAYLSSENIYLEENISDSGYVQFNSTEIPIFQPNTGGYVNTDDGGIQTLINFRNGKERFRVFSLHDIKNNKLKKQSLKGKIVIIGITGVSSSDNFYTSAISGLKLHGIISGVEYHAHATSQIINAVINRRPLLKSWSEPIEYAWIIIWGFVPIIIARLTQSVWKNLLAVSASSIFLIGLGYLSLILWGWWVPIAPCLLILSINGLGLSAFAFYQHDRALKSQIHARQSTIEYTFTIIHNGPLQTLANALSRLRTEELPQEQLISQLEKLNSEIRSIGDFLQQETLNSEEILRLGSGLILDLNKPVNELFYEVYSSTLQRNDLKYFNTIKVKTRSFEPIEDRYLNIEYKRELCQFLEECLCNVGKHANGAKRIQVTGKIYDGWYRLSVKDNGCGINSPRESKGTKQCKNLARKLAGNFKRESISPKGCLCEINWPLTLKINFIHKIYITLRNLI